MDRKNRLASSRRILLALLVGIATAGAAIGATPSRAAGSAAAREPRAPASSEARQKSESAPTASTPAPVVGGGYVLESASAGTLGGASSSASYTGSAIAGQSTSSGEASSPSFSSSSGLLNDIDLDGDGVRGTDDMCPSDDATCSDTNVDGCIDLPDLDNDSDGVTQGSCDCNEWNATIWGTPGEIAQLALVHNAGNGQTILTWALPVPAGGTIVLSDLLRSNDPSDFTTGADCMLSNGTTGAVDVQSPLPGASFYYLVRAENLCPAQGSLGTDSELHLRVGRSCP